MDDAFNFLRLRDLDGCHSTAAEPPSSTYLERLSNPQIQLQQPRDPISKSDLASKPRLLVFSAADKGGLARLANSYIDHLSRMSSSLDAGQLATYFNNLAYTLAERRSFLAWKSFSVASSVPELQDLPAKMSAPVRSRASSILGFVFTGQGAQFAGMGKELLTLPTFLASMNKSEMYLDNLGCQWSLIGKQNDSIPL